MSILGRLADICVNITDSTNDLGEVLHCIEFAYRVLADGGNLGKYHEVWHVIDGVQVVWLAMQWK